MVTLAAVSSDKSSSELEVDLVLLREEHARIRELKSNIQPLRDALQRTMSRQITGGATISDVQTAQARLDTAIEALSRCSTIERAVVETEETLAFIKGRERTEFCRRVGAEYEAAYQLFVEQGRAMLITYQQLIRLNNQYLGLTNRPLFSDNLRQLHLPQITPIGNTLPTGVEHSS